MTSDQTTDSGPSDERSSEEQAGEEQASEDVMPDEPSREGRSKSLPIVVVFAGAAALAIGIWIAIQPRGDGPEGGERGVEVSTIDPWTPRSGVGYVGSQACRECHEEIADRYATHPMYVASRPIADECVAETSGEFSSGPGFNYRVETKDGKTRHIEQVVDSEGNEIFEQSVEIKYILGSGARGESFMHERDGRLFASPISWYTQKAKWDLAPGYQHAQHARFERPVLDRCAGCHSGRLNRGPDSGEDHVTYKQPIFLEHAIGCERCHGPGKDHIDFHNGDRKEDAMPDLSELSPSKRDAVCNQCHILGDEQFLRLGRSNSDFRPGDNVGDIWTTYVKKTPDKDSKETAVSHVQQMNSSTCFIESKGKLGCVTCHDPHFHDEREKRQVHYNNACQKCHAVEDCAEEPEVRAKEPANGSCIHCHMVKLSAMDIPHASQTDHRILRRVALASLLPTALAQGDNRKLVIFDLDDAPLPKLAKQRADAVVLTKKAVMNRDKDLASQAEKQLTEVAAEAPHDVLTLDHLAKSLAVQQKMDEAVKVWRRVLERHPENISALASLQAAAEMTNNAEDALKYCDRLIEVEPWQADSHYRKARLLGELRKTDDALQTAKKAIELNPMHPQAYALAASLLRRLGRFKQAAKLEQDARQIFLPRKK